MTVDLPLIGHVGEAMYPCQQGDQVMAFIKNWNLQRKGICRALNNSTIQNGVWDRRAHNLISVLNVTRT
jgi:hypothetical protein